MMIIIIITDVAAADDETDDEDNDVGVVDDDISTSSNAVADRNANRVFASTDYCWRCSQEVTRVFSLFF